MADENPQLRERLLQATTELLLEGGRAAVTTRAVSAAANVPPPTIYRKFGDLQGLLNAVAQDSFDAYTRQQHLLRPSTDPLEDLSRGWDLHIEYALANPAAYILIYGDPVAGGTATARAGERVLHALLTRVAESGRLLLGVEQAVRLLTAAASGVALSLIGSPPAERDLSLSTTVREAMFTRIISGVPEHAHLTGEARLAFRALNLRAVLADAEELLTAGELILLKEWLNRLSAKQEQLAAP